MSLISLIEGSKDFGIRTLFKNLTLHINEKEKLGLIGKNGSGKSTLLKVLAGLEPLGKGHRKCSPKLHIELVEQESALKEEKTVLQQVLEGCGEKRELLIRFNQLSEEIAQSPQNSQLLLALGRLSEQMDIANAWSLEEQCKEVLNRLGIQDLHRPIKELSGGYKKRVSLASALVAKPDVLLLDEPTNHLDASAVEWLQSWLEQYPGALVLVTHDRYVLDQVTNRMIEIDRGNTRAYLGNYSSFLKEKAKQEQSETSSIKKFKGVLRRELAWLKQGPKARSTKQKARIQRIKAMRAEPKDEKKSRLEIKSANRRIGKLVIEAKDLQITTNNQLNGPLIFKDFTYSFSREDRVGIIGPNGSGKSSLLDLIAGRRRPTNGELRLGETIQLGYLDQHSDVLNKATNSERKVIDFVEEVASRITINKRSISSSQLLEQFLFSPTQQHSPISKLSGGERRRLALCRMLIQAPNVLLLDEPTNDLDIHTLSVLEDFLEDFQGCVVVVSHDRYFLDRTVDRIFSFSNGLLNRFEGNYSSFIEQSQSNQKREITANNQKLTPRKTSSNELSEKAEKSISNSYQTKNDKSCRRRSFKESKELEAINTKLPELEKERLNLEVLISQGGKDLTVLSKKLAQVIIKIEEYEDRWIELSELKS